MVNQMHLLSMYDNSCGSFAKIMVHSRCSRCLELCSVVWEMNIRKKKKKKRTLFSLVCFWVKEHLIKHQQNWKHNLIVRDTSFEIKNDIIS